MDIQCILFQRRVIISLKRKIIHFSRTVLAAWQLPEDEDTVWHARLRIVLYTMTVAVELLCIAVAFYNRVLISRGESFRMGCLFLFGVPFVHQAVRPGRGKIWLISLGIFLLVFVLGLCLLLIALRAD